MPLSFISQLLSLHVQDPGAKAGKEWTFINLMLNEQPEMADTTFKDQSIHFCLVSHSTSPC